MERESVIRTAALTLLVEVGYDRMTMDAVAARARASKATIYRKWPGKLELVLDAIRLSAGHETIELPDTGSLRGDIVATLGLVASGMGQHDIQLMAGVLRAMREAPELASCVRKQLIEEKRYVGDTLVARAVARGELPEGATADIFHTVAPALMFFRAMVHPPVDDAYIAYVTDDVLVPLLQRSQESP